MIDFVSYSLHFWLHRIIICDGSVMDRFYAVGHPSCLRKFIYQLLDTLCSLGYFLYELPVSHAQSGSLVFIEDSLHALHVSDELTLIMGGYGDDMIH